MRRRFFCLLIRSCAKPRSGQFQTSGEQSARPQPDRTSLQQAQSGRSAGNRGARHCEVLDSLRGWTRRVLGLRMLAVTVAEIAFCCDIAILLVSAVAAVAPFGGHSVSCIYGSCRRSTTTQQRLLDSSNHRPKGPRRLRVASHARPPIHRAVPHQKIEVPPCEASD
jgi:hypothetical protein